MTTILTKAQWASARASALSSIPAMVQEQGLPSVLLPYQAEAVQRLEAGTRVLFVEKSRRIGLTWGLGSYAVLRAARQKAHGGMDVMYISYSREMTREFIDVCAMWARAFNDVATAVEETLFDQGNDGKAIQAFRIQFASGFEIMALSSSPRGLRGKQGVVIIDEAAFVDDLPALLKSAMANLIWGGQVVVCSTHFGTDNEFNVQIQDILAGRSKYSHLRIDLDQALEQGFGRRVFMVRGMAWSREAEAEFRQGILDDYRDNADEELYCIPSQSTGAWLPGPLIEARMTVEAPVLRLELPKDYLHLSKLAQASMLDPFLVALKAELAKLDLGLRYAFGYDYARTGDLSAASLMAIEHGLKRREALAYELRNVPDREQQMIARIVLDHVRQRLVGAAFDATGMGSGVAEEMGRVYGLRPEPQDAGLIIALKFSEAWYRAEMPPLKAAFEDDGIALIRDAEHMSDLRTIKLIRGIARVPTLREGETEKKRHGDHAIAVALAHWASRLPWSEYDYRPIHAADHADPMGRPDQDDTRAWWKPPLGGALKGWI